MEFDPLDYHTIADTVVSALLDKPIEPLPPAERFPGAGVYLIYYGGGFAAYSPISNTETPIYVGKAIPAGSRRSPAALKQMEQASSPMLNNRLREHSRSIDVAKNIDVGDFQCRYLAIKPIWITIAEALLIQKFHPVWNACVDGFGLHEPSKNRYKQKKSDWDTLHPGRAWEPKMSKGKPVAQIMAEIETHFSSE